MRAGEQVPRPRPGTVALLEALTRLLAEGRTVPEAATALGEPRERMASLARAYGLRASEEAIRRAKGKAKSAEARAKIAAGQRGRTRSPETRAKMAAARAKQVEGGLSPDARANISAAAKAREARKRGGEVP